LRGEDQKWASVRWSRWRCRACKNMDVFGNHAYSAELGTALCHLLEMPAKITLDGTLWLTLLQTLYPPAFRDDRRPFRGRRRRFQPRCSRFWSAGSGQHSVGHSLGALRMAAAHTAFWVWVAPVNATMTPLTPETLPADLAGLRDQWEYTHTARAVLQIIALGALVFSILCKIPTGESKCRSDAGGK